LWVEKAQLTMDQVEQVAMGDALIEHWKSLLVGDELPTASSFKPSKSLKNLLPHVFLLEVVSGDVTLSLVGPGQEERLAVNPTGISYLDTLPPERRYPTIVRVQAMMQAKCGCRANVDEEMADGSISPSVLTAVPFDGDNNRKPCLLAIVPPSTSVMKLGAPKVPFMSRPFLDFTYVDLGFGCPPAFSETLMGIGPADEGNVWPDLEKLVDGR
jgi:hypothetical protein